MDNKYTSPVTQLLTYGDCPKMERSPNKWPNYLELGLTQAHIPQLISMATDEELNWADSEGLEVWAPIHAWRALGQLQAIEAIKPLLHFESVLEYDDWIAEELPYVYGSMGEKAIPALTEYLFDDLSELRPCITATYGLLRIGEMHPETWTECVSILTKKLECFTDNAPELNAFMIDALVNFKAVESMPTIKKA